MVDETVSSTVSLIVSVAEDTAKTAILERAQEYMSNSYSLDDELDYEYMMQKSPIVVDDDGFVDFYKDTTSYHDSGEVAKLSDSLQILITEYRIRIRKIRRTGVNGFLLIEENMVHNCKYITDLFSTKTDELVFNLKESIDNKKIEVILTTESTMDTLSTDFSHWYDHVSSEAYAAYDKLSRESKMKVDDTREYLEDEFISDANAVFINIDEKLQEVNNYAEANFHFGMGILGGEIPQTLDSESESDDEEIIYISDIDEKDVLEDLSGDVEIPDDMPAYRASKETFIPEVIHVEMHDTRYKFEEDAANIDKYLVRLFDFAPSLNVDDDGINPFVKSKFQQAVFEYKHDPSLFNAFKFCEALSDVTYEPVFVHAEKKDTHLISLEQEDYENEYDLRSDMHNSGKLTRRVLNFQDYQITTTELARPWKPVLYWNLAREFLRFSGSEDPNDKIQLSNILSERQHQQIIRISPEILAQIMSPKTMNLFTDSSKSQLNLDLAIRTQNSVNLPYNLAYKDFPIREQTAGYAHAVMESMKWRNYGNGINFHL